MRERDVPQEGNRTLAGHRKAVYAIADDGKLRLVPSRGWEVEEIVTRQAVEDLEKRAMEARARALSGTQHNRCCPSLSLPLRSSSSSMM